MAPTRVRQHTSSACKNKSWSIEDDNKLAALVMESQPVNWFEICRHFPNRTQTQVVERWTKVLDPGLLKGSWTRQEDETIIQFVAHHGTKSWARLASLLPGRIGKQCRERWVNHLDPTISHGPWTAAEDQLLIDLHNKFGNHWTKIGEMIPNRSDNAIKNRWNSTLAKRIQAFPETPTIETPAPTPLMKVPRQPLPSIALLTTETRLPPPATPSGNVPLVLSPLVLATADPTAQTQPKSNPSHAENTAGLMNLVLHQIPQ